MLKLKLYAPIQNKLGISDSIRTQTLEIEDLSINNLYDLFDHLSLTNQAFGVYIDRKVPDLFEDYWFRGNIIVVDGNAIFEKSMKTVPLTKDSEISILPQYSGG